MKKYFLIALALLVFTSANVFADIQRISIPNILKSSGSNITLEWKISNVDTTVAFPNATSASIKVLVSIDSTSDRTRVRCGTFNQHLDPSSSILCEIAPNDEILLDIYPGNYKNGASGKFTLIYNN